MRRALTAITLCAALFLTGCTGEDPQVPETPEVTPSPTLTAQKTPFTLPYYPNASLHPITSENRTNLVLCNLVYQPLFELDNRFSPHGVLCASSSVSEDGLTWTLTLAEAYFSDGTQMSADHVAQSLELARTSAQYAARLADVTRVRAQEDGTVTLTLLRPNGALPTLLDIPVMYDNGTGALPLGTGPYVFVEDDGPLRLRRGASAPDTAPQEISLRAIESADDLIYAFDAGDISLVTSDLTGANALGYSSGYEAFDYPTTTMLYVGFQTASGVCQDVLIRQAISRSFDRDTVALSLLAGHAQATCLPVSPDCSLHSAQYEQSGCQNPMAVKELLDLAGCSVKEDGLLYKGRTAQSLVFVVNTDNSFKLTVADHLAGQLRDLGFSVELRKLSWEDYNKALATGTFDLYLGEVALTADFDLTALLNPMGSLNFGKYDNADTVLLLEQLRAAQEPVRMAAAEALWAQLQAETPFTPLCFKDHSILIQWRAVSGLEPTRQNPFYNIENLRFDA